jgi:hypothetical protein
MVATPLIDSYSKRRETQTMKKLRVGKSYCSVARKKVPRLLKKSKKNLSTQGKSL